MNLNKMGLFKPKTAFSILVFTSVSYFLFILLVEDTVVIGERKSTANEGVSETAKESQTKETPLCSMEARMSHEKELCRQPKFQAVKYPNESKITQLASYRHMWVSDKLKIIYCALGKTGTCSMMKMLIEAVNKDIHTNKGHNGSALDEAGLKPLIRFNSTEAAKRLHTYHKFIVVRHPMIRLVSAYVNKFVDYYYSSSAQRIINATRGEPAEPKARPTWKEFITYIPKAEVTNGHWCSQFDACRPCDIKYDAVIKIEFVKEEINALKPFLGDGARVLHCNPSSAGKTNQGQVKTYTDYINELSDEDILNIKRHYERDFEFFGYEIRVHDRKLFLNEECPHTKV